MDAVAKARADLVLARTTLERRLREQLEDELSNLQARVDVAVRYAYEAGHSKGSIVNAMGSKYYGLVNDSLERTQGITEAEGADPLDLVYMYDPNTGHFSATYRDHGPDQITGEAMFQFKKLDDGTSWFFSKDPLYNSDYTQRNDVVDALDNRQDGYYYEEALGWVSERLQADA